MINFTTNWQVSCYHYQNPMNVCLSSICPIHTLCTCLLQINKLLCTDREIFTPTEKIYFSVALFLSVFFCRCTDRGIDFSIFLSVLAISMSVFHRQENSGFQ